MIEISDSAARYFQHLIQQQDEEGMGLRISVEQPGTPHASCDLRFCPQGEEGPRDRRVTVAGFDFFIDPESLTWLDDAEIDFQEETVGGQLTIKAPGIKGHAPAEDAPLEEKVEWVLTSEINPMLASHGGLVRLVEVTESQAVVLQFGGGCQGCGMADVTLKQGISKTLHERVPEISEIVDVTDHQSGENPYYAPGAQGESAL